MISTGIREVSGALPALAAAALLAGCYSFSGGGGLPSHIRTAYVEPVDNQSTRFGLSETLTEELLQAVRQRLGLQLAAEEEADAIIRATIRGFRDDAVNFDAVEGTGAEIFQRRITIVAEVAIIDREQNLEIWVNRNVTGTGEYVPGSETDEEGTIVAIENLVQRIVDGAQSQW